MYFSLRLTGSGPRRRELHRKPWLEQSPSCQPSGPLANNDHRTQSEATNAPYGMTLRGICSDSPAQINTSFPTPYLVPYFKKWPTSTSRSWVSSWPLFTHINGAPRSCQREFSDHSTHSSFPHVSLYAIPSWFPSESFTLKSSYFSLFVYNLLSLTRE